jgi:streptogramin lyase
VAADPAVEFPALLSGLPNSPSHLAVDPKTGDLWFLIFTYDGKSNTLYQYSAADGKVETFDIPSSSGSELYSAISVDSRGHVISAEGSVITDFDPSSGEFIQLSLPEPATKAVAYSPADGSSILDMSLTDDGLAYLSRMNIPAITELDLSTGNTRELLYPLSFGPAYDIELAGGSLWMTSKWNIAGLSTAQTGNIDLTTGEFAVLGPGTTAISAPPDGQVLGVRASSQEAPAAAVVEVSGAGLAALSIPSESDEAEITGGLGIRDFIAVDPGTGAAWVTGEGSESIFLVDGRAVREYELPVYGWVALRCDVDPGEPCPEVRLKTQVRGLAAAPNGDLYFSDATLSRVGVIRADQ